MNKNEKIIMVCIIVIIAFLISRTYAILNGDTLKDMFSEVIAIDEDAYGETKFNSNNLDLVPILDSDVTVREDNVIHISFVVGGSSHNTLDKVIYDISLSKLKIDCNLISPYLKWKLVKNNVEISSGSLDYKFDTIDNGRLVLTDTQQDLAKYNKEKVGYDEYDFYMWLSDSCQSSDINECTTSINQDNLMNKKISGKIQVELYSSEKKTLTRNPSKTLDTSTCITNND